MRQEETVKNAVGKAQTEVMLRGREGLRRSRDRQEVLDAITQALFTSVVARLPCITATGHAARLSSREACLGDALEGENKKTRKTRKRGGEGKARRQEREEDKVAREDKWTVRAFRKIKGEEILYYRLEALPIESRSDARKGSRTLHLPASFQDRNNHLKGCRRIVRHRKGLKNFYTFC